tara:strand:+ start:53 stop:232 length:180 start_codon:yes stop_codon:yes gene_type:complete
MKKFTVPVGSVKKANEAIINSNKLKSVFYNIGNKFLCNPKDYNTICDLLERIMIKSKVC